MFFKLIQVDRYDNLNEKKKNKNFNMEVLKLKYKCRFHIMHDRKQF
jgi:hypothetical protein